DLDRHGALELAIERAEHRAHAALAEDFHDLVTTIGERRAHRGDGRRDPDLRTRDRRRVILERRGHPSSCSKREATSPHGLAERVVADPLMCDWPPHALRGITREAGRSRWFAECLPERAKWRPKVAVATRGPTGGA